MSEPALRNTRRPRPPPDELGESAYACEVGDADASSGRSEPPRAAARPTRARRWLGRLSLMTGIIVVVAASVLVAWGMRRYLHSSPRFAIRTVEVGGNVRRTAHQIAKRAGLEVGQNIFALELTAAQAAIESDEWIERAEVTRELPGTVRVHVVEREARAVAVVRGQLYLVDPGGNIYKSFAAGDPGDLPVVTGIDPETLVRDREGVTRELRRALDLIADLERVELDKRYPIEEVHMEADGRLTVTVGSEGIGLYFGPPPFRLKVEKALRVLQEVQHRKAKVAKVFLDNEAHPERVVVRMR